MNTKRFILATVGAFAFVFVFEMLWHGFVMNGMYEATASLWRPQNEFNMIYNIASQLLFAVVLAFIYTKIGKHIPCKRGIAFGLFAGLLLAAPLLGSYASMPIPLTMSLMWMAACILKGLGSGVVIAAIYKVKE